MNTRRMLAMGAMTLSFLGSVAVGTALNSPKTWIVDDDGGQGVNFTDIAPAVAAADDGDLILVLDGNYNGFTVGKSLTLIGEGVTRVSGTAEVDPAPGPVILASMDVRALDITGCDQTVIVDDVQVAGGVAYWEQFVGTFLVNVDDSADVRFIECSVPVSVEGNRNNALRVHDSRVELVSSTFQGAFGYNDDSCFFVGSSAYGGHGGDGMQVLGTSRLHAVDSLVTGGDGGYAGGVWCTYAYAGDGGDAARIQGTSELIAAGGSFLAGDGGAAYAPNGYGGDCGSGGNGIGGAGAKRFSGVIVTRGLGAPGCPDGKKIASPKTQATPPDPRLERLSIPVSGFFGAPVTLRVHGNPGSFTRLFLGQKPQVVPSANVEVELLLKKRLTVDLGFMPAKGYVDWKLPLGPDWPKGIHAGGRLFVAQASMIYPGGGIRRTNSVPLVLR